MIANQSTTVAAEKTIMEIQSMLIAAKACSITTRIENQQVTAVMFQLLVNDRPVPFCLPCNWQGVLKAMREQKKVAKSLLTEEQARRVTWRIVRDWLRAQLSLIEAGQFSLAEVMMAWMLVSPTETLAQRILQGNGLLRLTQNNGEHGS